MAVCHYSCKIIRMKNLRIKVVCLNLFQGHAVVFQHSLICIKTSPVRSRNDNVLRNEIYKLPKLPLVLSDPLFGRLCCGNISYRANKLDLGQFIPYPMSHNVDIFDGSARHQ